MAAIVASNSQPPMIQRVAGLQVKRSQNVKHVAYNDVSNVSSPRSEIEVHTKSRPKSIKRARQMRSTPTASCAPTCVRLASVQSLVIRWMVGLWVVDPRNSTSMSGKYPNLNALCFIS
jgi:hypothetical protein